VSSSLIELGSLYHVKDILQLLRQGLQLKKVKDSKKTIHRKDKYFKLTLNSNSPPVYSTEVKTNMAAMTKFVNRIS